MLAVTGCTTGPEVSATSQAPHFGAQIAQAIEQASAQGVSQAQLDALKLARQQGEVTFEQTKVAAQLAVECMTAGGVEASYIEVTIRGVTLPQFSVQPDPNSADESRVADECETNEFDFISMMYQTQPSVAALRSAFDEEQAAQLVACLEAAGVAVEPDANWESATDAAGSAAADGNEAASECLGAALAP
jgi:hypothetical protein